HSLGRRTDRLAPLTRTKADRSRVKTTGHFHLLPTDCASYEGGPVGRATAIILVLGTTTTALADPQTAAREIAAQLAAGKFAAVCARFDDTMKAGLPADALETTWKTVTATAGPFLRVKGTRAGKALTSDVVDLTCAFANGDWSLKVSFDPQGRVAGLF